MSIKTLEWRKDFENLPDEAYILTKMKHGIISGTWDAEERVCRGYYWHDMEWNPYCFIVLEGSE
jgi:hypothetical protein